MAGKIVILRWKDSAYDSLGGILDLMAHEFAAEGFQVVMFAADGQDWPNKFAALLSQGGFSFALTMSGIGVDLAVEGGRLLWEAAQVPLFNWNCDHVCHYPSRHFIRNRFLLHGYVFPDHARYHMQHLSSNGMAFTVHIGIPPRSAFPGAPLPLTARNGRILFTKSSADTNAIEARWRNSGPLMQQILFPAAEELRNSSTSEFLPVVQRIGESLGLMLDGANHFALMLIRDLDMYVRHRRGNLVMKTLLNYPIDVYGSGWDHIPWGEGRAVYRGVGDWQTTMRELPQYLGRLSTSALAEDSFHDRIFFALAAGVPSVSDTIAFSRSHASALERYAFDLTPKRIEAAVDALLSDPADALDRNESTWQAMLPEFSMRSSAQRIIRFAGLRGVNARDRM